jgi:hypothetical protein
MQEIQKIMAMSIRMGQKRDLIFFAPGFRVLVR